MTSANPPDYQFNGLNYNSAFYTTANSNVNSALYVTTTTPQTISGQKTFTSEIIANGGLTVNSIFFLIILFLLLQ